jgi:hypothetical protein
LLSFRKIKVIDSPFFLKFLKLNQDFRGFH